MLHRLACRRFLIWSFVIGTLVFLPSLTGVRAQPRETLIIPLNRPQPVVSQAILWHNAFYRWTVLGRANIGTIGLPISATGAIGLVDVDARYVLTSLVLPDLNAPIKLPLDDNGLAGLRYCTVSSAVTQAMMPPTTVTSTRGTCNIFFATNALLTSSDRRLSAQFPSPSDAGVTAASYKPFRFLPDADTLNTREARYTATVQGADIPAQFLFIERLGESDNIAYSDNIDNVTRTPSTFILTLERFSPELLVIDRRTTAARTFTDRILNDVQPASAPPAPRRNDTLDCGNAFVGGAVVFTRLLRNRGIAPLSISSITVPTNAAFSVALSANTANLQRDMDSLRMDIRFSPRSKSDFLDSIVITTNDPTLQANGTGVTTTYTIYLRGTGVDGVLRPIGLPSVVSGTEILLTALSPVPIGGSSTVDVGVENGSASPLIIEEIVFPDGSSPFSARTSTMLPLMLAPRASLVSFLTCVFQPRTFGDFVDEIIVRGRNFPDLRLILRGQVRQASVDIRYVASSGLRDTINFGAVTGANFRQDSIIIRNTGNVALYVEVLRLASPNPAFQPTDVNEFLATPFSFNLRDNQPRLLSLIFQAQSFAGMARPGLREAALSISVREGTPDGPLVTTQRYVLRGRVGSVLSAGPPAVDDVNGQTVPFDSVYIGQNRIMTVPVRNVSQRSITLIDADAQIITPTTQTVFNIIDGGLRQRTYATGDSDAVSLRFTPNRLGTESALYQARYRNEDTTIQSLPLSLRGVGVSQSLRLVSAFNNLTSSPARISGDTVDIGDVLLGLEAPLVITLRNEGNVPLNPSNQVPFILIPATAPDGIFRITSQFNFQGGRQKPAIAPNADESSLALSFKPVAEADYLLRYTILNDTRSRIPTAPDSSKTFFIRGRGVQPDMDVAPRTLNFDSIPVTSCVNSIERTFTITNTGTSTLNCDALTLTPRMAGQTNLLFSFPSGQPTTFAVPPRASRTVRVAFTPPTSLGVPVQSFSDTVTITSNAPPPRNVQRVVLAASAVAAPAASVAVGNFRAQPGVRIAVPVELGFAASRNPLTQVNTAELSLAYNPTLLRYAGVETINTAAAGAQVRAMSSAATGVTMSITGMTETSPSQRRLVTVLFDTFIGTQAQTELALAGVKLGTAACPEVLTITRLGNGSFTPDSVCNLVQKSLPATNGNLFTLKSLNNATLGTASELGFTTAFETHVTLTLYSSRGDLVATLVDRVLPAGEYTVPLPLDRLGASTGLYFCRMQADIFHDVQKIVIVK
jgi:hypothetical protein